MLYRGTRERHARHGRCQVSRGLEGTDMDFMSDDEMGKQPDRRPWVLVVVDLRLSFVTDLFRFRTFRSSLSVLTHLARFLSLMLICRCRSSRDPDRLRGQLVYHVS